MNFTYLEPEQRESFEKDGFLVVRKALDPGTIEGLVEEGDQLAQGFLTKPEVLDRPEYNHLDLRPGLLRSGVFRDLVSHSATVPLIVQLLSPNIHLHSTSLTYKRPENPNAPTFRRGWHRDIRIPEDLGHRGLPCVGIKVCYCLTDFHRLNSGMTLMARGSHLRSTPLVIPEGRVDPVDVEVCDLELDAGDALLFENRIFHTAAPNSTDRASKVVIYGYAYRWMKQEVYLDSPGTDLLWETDLITQQFLGRYRDIDTRPWALSDWAETHGIRPETAS